jgi:hypothetical protein
MIDWSSAPEWATGAAMDDESGDWYWYESKPKPVDGYWSSDQRHEKMSLQPEETNKWKESWIAKPILLPNNNMFTETKTTTTEKKSPFVFEEGGPVHPVTYGNIHDGMSLRDYFAGQAMISMVGHSINIAEEAYQIADAMLEARTLKPE